MIKIDGSGKAYISLSKSFYRLESVKKAAEDFKDIGIFKVKEGRTIDITINPNESSESLTVAYEFCNYVLALMKNEAIV
jgi:hypothetical protein